MTGAGTRGLTLVELVAALAIFSLVAIMGLQTLSGMMRARDRTAGAAGDAAALSRGLVLLRADLKAAADLAFWPPEALESEPPLLDLSAEEGRFALSTEARAVLPDQQAAGTERVIWRHDRRGERLLRTAWPVLRPATDAARAPETVIFEDVAGLRLRAYAGPEAGWIGGWGQDAGVARPGLPRAVEVIVESGRYGALRVLVALP
ncbi:type II secretion system protein GspJ [Roseovarius ramblicola]|uniref:Type II secretion system protein J n=1 Tax=Roseovarius ramblicola TaxID=2022336 RepID=A0ABV5HXF4_9RHOB